MTPEEEAIEHFKGGPWIFRRLWNGVLEGHHIYPGVMGTYCGKYAWNRNQPRGDEKWCEVCVKARGRGEGPRPLNALSPKGSPSV